MAQKSAGIDMEQNYVTVTLCIIFDRVNLEDSREPMVWFAWRGRRVVYGSILCDPIQPNPSAD